MYTCISSHCILFFFLFSFSTHTLKNWVVCKVRNKINVEEEAYQELPSVVEEEEEDDDDH